MVYQTLIQFYVSKVNSHDVSVCGALPKSNITDVLLGELREDLLVAGTLSIHFGWGRRTCRDAFGCVFGRKILMASLQTLDINKRNTTRIGTEFGWRVSGRRRGACSIHWIMWVLIGRRRGRGFLNLLTLNRTHPSHQ